MSEGALSIQDLLSILRARKGRLPFEIGAFVALSACEALLERPSEVSAAHVLLTADGHVVLDDGAPASTDEGAARALHRILTPLLLAAGGEVPPMMLELVERGPADGRFELTRLRDELEASLLPLNRAAARRVLARLVRDKQRDAPTAKAESATATEVDADLDQLLGRPSVDMALDDLLAGGTTSPGAIPAPTPEALHVLPPAAAVSAEASDGAPKRRGFFADEGVAEQRPKRRGFFAHEDVASADGPAAEPRGASSTQVDEVLASDDHDTAPGRAPRVPIDEERPRPRRSAWLTVLAGFALLAAAAGAVATLRPDLASRLRGERDAERAAETPAALAATPSSRVGHLVVRVAPRTAQVLLFVGRGPVVAHGLPVGVAHEFVMLADGHAPARAVVPAEASWSREGERARYELAMQAGTATTAALAASELGPTMLEADAMGRPSGRVGDVRIITNPPSARVFMTVGFAPSAEIGDLPTDEGHELLVVAPGHEPRRIVVGPSDWTESNGRREAAFDVTLEPFARR